LIQNKKIALSVDIVEILYNSRKSCFGKVRVCVEFLEIKVANASRSLLLTILEHFYAFKISLTNSVKFDETRQA